VLGVLGIDSHAGGIEAARFSAFGVLPAEPVRADRSGERNMVCRRTGERLGDVGDGERGTETTGGGAATVAAVIALAAAAAAAASAAAAAAAASAASRFRVASSAKRPHISVISIAERSASLSSVVSEDSLASLAGENAIVRSIVCVVSLPMEERGFLGEALDLLNET